jgi:hypothetical protein
MGKRSILEIPNWGALVLALGVILTSCSLASKATKGQDASRNGQDTPSEVPIVEFCNLLKNPFQYEARLIRIKARLSRFRDYVTFYDPNCVPTHPLISVVFSPSFQHETESETGKRLDQIINGSIEAREGNVSVFVSAVGLFKAIPSSERSDFTELQYEFTIREIE